ncbi:MAG: signal recognition particle receptor subunit alpha, partial [Candidatus Nanopelagicales bacterium]
METIGLVIAIAVVAVVLVATLVVRLSKGPGTTEKPRRLEDKQRGAGGRGGGSSVGTTEPPISTTDFPPLETGSADTRSAETSAGAELEIVERPEPAVGRMARLRSRLTGSGTLGQGLLRLLSQDSIDDQSWDEIEELLIGADLGVGVSMHVVNQMRDRVRVDGTVDPVELRKLLRSELLVQVDPAMDRSLLTDSTVGRPAVVLVVGVNGTGKTTTTGKLARLFVAEDRDVILGAADTFRAAASEQLQTWGDRVGVPVVRGPEGGDPASVAFDAVKAGIDNEADVVIIDTAGRLHTKTGLMDELGKVKRVIEKQSPVDEV